MASTITITVNGEDGSPCHCGKTHGGKGGTHDRPAQPGMMCPLCGTGSGGGGGSSSITVKGEIIYPESETGGNSQ